MLYQYALGFLIFIIATYTAIHALINKKDSRAAFGWIAVCYLLPLLGPFLYFLFGINRVRTRAKKLTYSTKEIISNNSYKNLRRSINQQIPNSLKNLETVTYRITGLHLKGGNDIEILYSGEHAYPAMLEAIQNAKKYVYLCSYIFKADNIGQKFIQYLVNAKNRGVEVYILIDGIGEYYSWKKVKKYTEKYDLQARLFLPPKLIPFNFNINLRNHRKFIIIDDMVSFAGGMNICDEYYPQDSKQKPLKDVHFKITGSVTLQLKKIFEEDWRFTGGKIFSNNTEKDEPTEPILCRAIVDGPAESIDNLSIILVSAINSAVDDILLMTPYFLPSRELISAMQTASLRGVDIRIILPEKNNLNYVSWAMRHMLWELLERGINIYYQPEPFEHTKLFIVDNQFCLIGSANIDPRSLRLNYEVGIEVYDGEFSSKLSHYFKNVLKTCRKVSLEEVDNRKLILKIRDGVAWLFSPYL